MPEKAKHSAQWDTGGTQKVQKRCALDAAAFRSVVRDGLRVERAMPAFSHLDETQLLALRHYIRQQAHATAEQ